MSGLRRALGAELAHLARDRFDLALLTLLPLLFLLVMGGMLFAGVPQGLGVRIVDQDHSAVSRAVIRAIAASDTVRVAGVGSDLAEAFAAVRREQAVAVVVLPAGLGDGRARAAPRSVEIFYQTAFLSTGALASTRLQLAVTAELARHALAQSGLSGAALLHAPPPGVEVTVLGNPDRKSVV